MIDGSTDLPPELRLQEGERVIMICAPGPTWFLASRYIGTFGLYSFWRKKTIWVLTNQRVISRRGILSVSERSVPTQYVQDATVQSTWVVGSVVITTAGGAFSLQGFGPLPKEEAQRFADAIMATARANWANRESGATSGLENASDVAGLLRKLADLRDSGVLTEDEFQAKKMDLLTP